MIGIFWIIAAVLFALFVVLFLVRVLRKKAQLKDGLDGGVNQIFNFNEFLKMAYPTSFIYAILFFLFLIPTAMGVWGDVEHWNVSDWILPMIGVYIALWLTLHVIDMDCRSRNVPSAVVLKFINTNTGVGFWNYVLLLVSIVILVVSAIMVVDYHIYFVCGPLFMAVTFGVLINLFMGSSDDWNVKKPSQQIWRPQDGEVAPEKVKIKAAVKKGSTVIVPTNPAMATKKAVERSFDWNLKEKWNIDVNEQVKVTLFEEDWTDPKQEARQTNPFYGEIAEGDMKWQEASIDLKNSVLELLQGPALAGETSEQDALSAIINSAVDIADKYNLADFEIPDLLLHFCQSSIQYVPDQDSIPIKKFNIKINDEDHLEYIRFASESLFDKEGDCDCKSILAYKLLTMLGKEVKLIELGKKGSSSPSHAALLLKDESNRYEKCKNYPEYSYCEATGEGWEIGMFPEEMDEDSIRIII